MKIYTVIGGINGAGKSSFTGSLKYQRDDLGVIIDVDKLAAQLGGDEYEAGKQAVEKINNCIASGVNFTQETTLSGGYPKKVAKAAREAGYYVRMFYIGIDTKEESEERIKNRVRHGGHNIPQVDIERRFARRLPALCSMLPYCNEVSFFDNRNGFVEVAEYRNGELLQKGAYSPKWLAEILEYMHTNL
ncbi:MAG: hypothetical protein GXZ14_08910 [Ruminococcaceae bacterium]|nr:hypothetical protein [Oscillospiraceae bacterium]